MAFDALPIESVQAPQEFVFESGESQHSPVTVDDMKDFKSPQLTANNLQEILPGITVIESSPEQDNLDNQSKELTEQLTSDMEPAEYMGAFDSFMQENGDQMYADAESIDPEHPLEAVAESLNRAMEDTGYTFRAAESENGVAISKDGAEAGTAAVGPSMGDILGIPQQ